LEEEYKKYFLREENQELSDKKLLQISDKESKEYKDFDNLVDVSSDNNVKNFPMLLIN